MAKKKQAIRSKFTAVREETVVLPCPTAYLEDENAFGPTEIVFKIRATPENWSRLCSFGPDDDRLLYLARMLEINILSDMRKKMDELFRTKPRGIHAKRIREAQKKSQPDIIQSYRTFTAAAMILTMHWLELPEKDWPLRFTYLIHEFRETGKDILDKRSKKLNPAKITYQWWKKEHQFDQDNGLVKGPKDYQSFRQTYIVKNDTLQYAKTLLEKNLLKDLIKEKGQELTIQDVVEEFLTF